MTIENGKYYELGKRTYWLFILERTATAIVLLVVAILFSIVSVSVMNSFTFLAEFTSIVNIVLIALVALALLIGLTGFAISKLEYKVCRIMLDDSSLRIIKGILHKRETAIPYRRIQSVEINQSLIQRFFKVAHVAISTTTDLDEPGELDKDTDEEVVPLMDYDLAQAVTNELTKRAEVERVHVTNTPLTQ